MKKTKWFSLVFLLVALFTACGDDYDDSGLRGDLAALEQRVAKLEELCQQMNTNISALQTVVDALEKNDYVTNVAPVTRGEEVIGYTVTFQKAGTITIFNGEGVHVDGPESRDNHVFYRGGWCHG